MISIVLKLLLKDFFALFDVFFVIFQLHGLNSTLERDEAAAVYLRNEENNLQYFAKSLIDFILLVVGTVLGQGKLYPQFLDDSFRKVIILKEVNFLPNPRFLKFIVELPQFPFDLFVFLLKLTDKLCTFLSFHEFENVLVADLVVLNHERVLHWEFFEVVKHF